MREDEGSELSTKKAFITRDQYTTSPQSERLLYSVTITSSSTTIYYFNEGSSEAIILIIIDRGEGEGGTGDSTCRAHL